MLKDAHFSDCQKYRYSLIRIWDEDRPKIMFIMLNPSTADDNKDDATIRRCIEYAKSWGYGGLYVCNLFAYRSTDKTELFSVDNPFGDNNIQYIMDLSEKVDKIICAWGNKPVIRKLLNGNSEFDMLKFGSQKLHYLELSKEGTPKHPLYLKAELTPRPLIIKVQKGLYII